MNTEEIKLLQAQNEALKKQCNNLQQEVKQWKHEYEMLDACIELEQGKIAELKAENDRLKEEIETEITNRLMLQEVE
jgi:cell division protein FtsB